MNIFSITNIPEMRSIFHFNRISNNISEIVRRLETGQRIITGKDDPSGLISREAMRTDIRGIQAAQRNTMAANGLLASAESGLANISRMLLGDINNRDDNGLLGLIYNDTIPTSMKRQQINDILNLIDGTVRTTTYNGQQILNGSMGYRLSGVESGKLSNVSVTGATFSSSQGLPVTISVLEQAAHGTLRVGVNHNEDFNLQLTGASGETIDFSFLAAENYDRDDILAAVNAKTNETGVQARLDITGLIFETVEVGSRQTFQIAVQNGSNIIDDLASGKDVLARVNGREVRGDGRHIEFSSHDLTMSATISSRMKVGERTEFNVTGGALFQLGKDVQASSQYRMVLPSMTVSRLGGASGVLEDLRTIDLETDAGKALAYKIVNEAVNMVATQRGRIGAVQRHVLDSNAMNLDIQLERVMESEGLISNVDMAMESSRLNRAEILAQSAMSAILHSRSFGQFILKALL